MKFIEIFIVAFLIIISAVYIVFKLLRSGKKKCGSSCEGCSINDRCKF